MGTYLLIVLAFYEINGVNLLDSSPNNRYTLLWPFSVSMSIFGSYVVTYFFFLPIFKVLELKLFNVPIS